MLDPRPVCSGDTRTVDRPAPGLDSGALERIGATVAVTAGSGSDSGEVRGWGALAAAVPVAGAVSAET